MGILGTAPDVWACCCYRYDTQSLLYRLERPLANHLTHDLTHRSPPPLQKIMHSGTWYPLGIQHEIAMFAQERWSSQTMS